MRIASVVFSPLVKEDGRSDSIPLTSQVFYTVTHLAHPVAAWRAGENQHNESMKNPEGRNRSEITRRIIQKL